MSVLFNVNYVKGSAAVDELRKLYRRVDAAGPEWIACGFGDSGFPDEAFGERRDEPEVFASAKLSKRFGEAIYIYSDSRADELLYDHSRDGRLVRKLMWTSDGSECTWSCVAGEPEPWEDALFDPRQLATALGMVEPEERAAVEAAFRDRHLVPGARWPHGSAHFAQVIERHFGIIRPG
jgi:hypothetical protein